MNNPVNSLSLSQEEDANTSMSVVLPKPPTPPQGVHIEHEPESASAIPRAPAVADPPPPYPSRERRTRGDRERMRAARRAAQLSNESGVITATLPASSSSDGAHLLRLSVDPSLFSPSELSPHSPEDGGSETTPLLSPRRRPRTLSHSTAVSTHSIAQTVLSLFQADDVADDEGESFTFGHMDERQNTTANTSRKSAERYFRPLWRGSYYLPLVHLLVVNFLYALLAFVYLFAGTLTGTTLLIALPLGAVLCWFNLAGARTFARGEIALQSFFHGPLVIQPPNPPYPIFSRPNTTPSTIEAGQSTSPNQPSFLRNTYIMFTDQTSYQAIFYFLVIKPSITLFLTIALAVLVPVAFAFVIPAPAMLRAVKRIGIWQANIALEGLLQPRL